MAPHPSQGGEPITGEAEALVTPARRLQLINAHILTEVNDQAPPQAPAPIAQPKRPARPAWPR